MRVHFAVLAYSVDSIAWRPKSYTMLRARAKKLIPLFKREKKKARTREEGTRRMRARRVRKRGEAEEEEMEKKKKNRGRKMREKKWNQCWRERRREGTEGENKRGQGGERMVE